MLYLVSRPVISTELTCLCLPHRNSEVCEAVISSLTHSINPSTLNGHPWFPCIANARGQWQLYWRTGPKASCRIKTTRTAHMPGEGKTWAVYKQKSSKSSLAATSCTVLSNHQILHLSSQTHRSYRSVMKCLSFQVHFLKIQSTNWGHFGPDVRQNQIWFGCHLQHDR